MLSVRNKNVFLFGYYGKSNIGDDIMLLNLVKLIQEKEVKKIIVLVDPAFNLQNHFHENVSFIYGIRKNILVLIKTLIISQIFIWGGGTCFFDNPSTRGLKELYYITMLRKLLGNNLKNYFIGVGAEKLNKTKSIIRKILSNTDGIVVRDSLSKENLVNLFPQISQNFSFLEVYNDIVLTSSTKNIVKTSTSNTKILKKKYITFSGHYKYTNNDSLIEHTAKQLELVMERLEINYLIFLPSKYDKQGDNLFHYKLADILIKSKELRIEVLELKSIQKYFDVIKFSEYHIGMRLHSLILADIFSIPKLSLAYQEKIYQYDSKALDVYFKWSELSFTKVNKEKLLNLLEVNTKNYENFFK